MVKVSSRLPGNHRGHGDSWQVQQVLCETLGINYLGHRTPAEIALLLRLSSLFEDHEFAAGHNLEGAQEPWRQVHIVKRGILKLYQQSEQGRPCIHYFFREGDIVWPAIHASRSPNHALQLGVVKRSRLAQAPFRAFRDLLRRAGRWEAFALSLNQKIADQALMREASRRFHTTPELYQELLEEHADLLGLIPDCQLAQWMGISPETFSRLKRQAG